MSQDLDLLAVGPHPDDVELFCGGTVAKMARLGHRVGILDLTEGERASNGTVEERRAEAKAAAAALGVAVRENLGLPDGGLAHVGEPGMLRLVEALRRLRPEVLLLPWTEARHPDHAAAGELGSRAAFFSGVRKVETDPPQVSFRPRQVLFYQMRYRFPPSFLVDTSDDLEAKRAAIGCYASQVAPTPGAAATLVGSPRAVEAILDRDRYHGSMIGTAAAECFLAESALGIADPIAHFRANPFTEAHAFEGRR